jgi:alpha-L-arabinofuranosidase
VLEVARTLRIGSLRYPGGSPSNHWNLSAGRWIGGQGDPNDRCNSQPLGTFTPAKYMEGLGQQLRAPPIWNINVVSLPPAEQLGQIDALKAMGVPVTYLELGNEQANPCGESGASNDYLATVAPVVARTRQLFPSAKIAIIGSWANPAEVSPLVNWTGCARMLANHRALFDAVTVHQYMPGNNTLMSYPADQRRTVTLATAEPLLRFHVATVAENIGADVPILLDEYNWGGHWEGATTWSDRSETALRGALMSSYILSAIGTHGGVAALNWYSLFQQDGNAWSGWASCVKVSNQVRAFVFFSRSSFSSQTEHSRETC